MVNIICLRYKRYRKHSSKGYCHSCYQYITRKNKSDKSIKIKCQCDPKCKTIINSINTSNKPDNKPIWHIYNNGYICQKCYCRYIFKKAKVNQVNF